MAEAGVILRNGRSEDICADLVKLCGEQNVFTGGESLAVAPANVQELSVVLHYANSLGLRVTPRGAGTKARWAGEQIADLVVLTGRLNAVTEHVWQDMTCTVGAGCSWKALQTTLAQHGQFVALDPLWPDQATVGGIVAANDSGALRLAYGGLRDLVIGMTSVLADGTIARSGGKVVKNVAGYDLHKLACGAYGTLGIIAEVTFRLHAIPQSTRSFSVAAPSANLLGTLLLRLLDSHLSAQAMQLCADATGYVLHVKLAALPQVLDAQTEQLRSLSGELNLQSSEGDESVWSARQRLFEAAGPIVFKATMLPTQIAAISETIARTGGSSVTQANGILYGNAGTMSAEVLAGLRNELQAAGGSLVYLADLPEGEAMRWSVAPTTLKWMHEIRKRFDPNGILNSNCFAEAR